MIKQLILYILTIIFASATFAFSEDPFSRSFTSPSAPNVNTNIGFEGQNDVDAGVHVMIRYDVSKYYLKGVVVSGEGSIAIMSVPGSPNEILFVGDPIGNDMHTIKSINNDFIIAGKSNGEDVSISVSNPVQENLLN